MGRVDSRLHEGHSGRGVVGTKVFFGLCGRRIETERGCSRACTYCVMRRSTNGGMRITPMDRILDLVPADARRVGLVGAAVSDHPRIAELVDTLAASGREVGLSSLRPDRLNDALVGALFRAGHKTFSGQVDLFNALNNNAIFARTSSVGASLGNVTTILQGRLMRLAFQMKF